MSDTIRPDRRRRLPALALAALLPLLAAGCDLWGQPKPEQDHRNDFNALFGQHCVGCHGAEGKLGPAPPLNDELFLQLASTDAGKKEVRRILHEGRKTGAEQPTPMPAFAQDRLGTPGERHPGILVKAGPLAEDQIEVLATGIFEHWAPKTPIPGDWPPYIKPASEKTGDAEKGVKIYARECKGCHDGGKVGDKPVGPILEPAFLDLISEQALRRIVITGRPDLGMPNLLDRTGKGEKPLNSQDITDLVAYLKAPRQPAAPKGK